MNELDLLIDLHLMNERQAPGSDDATKRAINGQSAALKKQLAMRPREVQSQCGRTS